jgi:hypothetical protein
MLKVNGAEKRLEVAPWTTLLDALRERKRGVTTGNAEHVPR